MSENSKIEWTDHTFNPWEGCQKIGPGCDHCYAETRNARFGGGVAVNWGPGAPRRRTSASNWRKPIRWNANACWFVQCNDCGWRGESKGAVCGRCSGTDTSEARQRVFCASLADVFDNAVDPAWRRDLFNLILSTPNLDWLLLTKRIGNANAMLPADVRGSPRSWGCGWPNIWIGATICNQEEADRDIPKLLALPAAVRFLSMEPLLGPIDLRFHIYCEPTGRFRTHAGKRQMELRKPADGGLHWVIAGGESGTDARPMHPDWARSLRDQCNDAGVSFFFKQWGEWLPRTQFSGANVDDPPEQTRFATREYIDGAWRDVGKPDYWASLDGEIDGEQRVGRVGKKAAGRLLDGREWNEVPE